MGERVRFLAEPRNDRVNGARLGKAIHPRESYVAPPPLILRRAQHERPLPGDGFRLGGRGGGGGVGLGEGGGDFVVLPEGVQVLGYGVEAAMHGVQVELGCADFLPCSDVVGDVGHGDGFEVDLDGNGNFRGVSACLSGCLVNDFDLMLRITGLVGGGKPCIAQTAGTLEYGVSVTTNP